VVADTTQLGMLYHVLTTVDPIATRTHQDMR